MKVAGDPITPQGMSALKARYDHLLGKERPEIVEIVSWAAGNGDRSENGDYLYGRKRMREIDRELAHLARTEKLTKLLSNSRLAGFVAEVVLERRVFNYHELKLDDAP